jgi:hypothetical protein
VRLRRLLLLLACACCVAAGVGLARVFDGAADAAPAVSKSLHVGETFLFSQAAAGGSLRGGTLTLVGVDDTVTRFADRPARDAQAVDIRDFLARWRLRFASSPPNAVLSYRVASSPRPRELVLELRRPRYDAASRTATYSVRVIRETADRFPGTKHPRTPVKYPLPSTFTAASLFIDDTDRDTMATVHDKFLDTYQWNPGASQCAGYGQVDDNGGLDVELSYDSYDSGKCFFLPTYARFDIIQTQGTSTPIKIGTITLDGYGNLVSCHGMACAAANEENNESIQILGASSD